MNIGQLIQLINELLQIGNAPNETKALGPLQPLLVQFMQKTPLNLTTANNIVIGAWGTVLAIANAFFLLLIVTGVIQMMLSHTTGTLSIPVSQFVPKILMTGLLMNLSFFFGQDLLLFNNLMCEAVNANLSAFLGTLNNGSQITLGQGFLLFFVTFILLNVGIIRLLFQAFERLVLWNLLFVLSPLAFLLAFLPLTASVFSFWGRMFVMVTFTQFVQFLALALALAILANAGQAGFVGYLMGIAMLYFVAKIPALLSRFPSMGVSSSQGIGHLISSTLLAARLLAM